MSQRIITLFRNVTLFLHTIGSLPPLVIFTTKWRTRRSRIARKRLKIENLINVQSRQTMSHLCFIKYIFEGTIPQLSNKQFFVNCILTFYQFLEKKAACFDETASLRGQLNTDSH